MAKLLFLTIALALMATVSNAGILKSGKLLPPNFPTPMEILSQIQKNDGKAGPIFEVDFAYWMDGFFEAYRKVFEFNGWDNFKLHLNSTSNFEREYQGTVYQGQLTNYDRVVSGAQSLHRTGPSKFVIDYIQPNGEVGDHIYFRLTAQLGFDSVAWNQKMFISWMGLTANPNIVAGLENIQINFAGRIQSDCTMELESQDVTIGNTVIDITKIEGPIGDIIDFITSLVEIGLKESLNTMTETIIRWVWEDIEDLFREHSVICDDTCPQKEHIFKPAFNFENIKK